MIFLTSLQSRLKSANFLNSVWNISDTLFLPLIMIVTTPFFIRTLGLENYGIWLLVNSIATGMGVLNFGLSESVIKFISQKRTENIDESISETIKNIFGIQHLVSLCILIIGLIFYFVIDEFKFFDIKNSYLFRSLILLGVVLFILKLYEQIFLSVFKGFERYDFSGRLSIISKLLIIIIQVVIAFYSQNLIFIFEGSIILSVLILSVEYYYTFRFVNYSIFKTKLNRERIKEILNFSFWSWILSVSSILGSQLDKYLVAALAGVTYFTYYSIGLMIASNIHSIFSASASWIFPNISRKIQKNEDVKHFYYDMQAIVVGAGLFCLIVFFLFSDTIIGLWLNYKDYIAAIDIIKLFICFTALSITSIVPYYFMNGSGLIKINTLSSLSGTIITVASMTLFFQFFSFTGLIFGRLVTPIFVGGISRTLLHFKVLKEKDYFSGLKLVIPSLMFLMLYFTKEWYFHLIIILFISASFYYFYFMKSRLVKAFSN